MAKKKEAVKNAADNPGEKRHRIFGKAQSHHPRIGFSPYEPDC